MKFTGQQVFILVLAVVAGIAFVETSAPIWTLMFWRQFVLKLMVYGAVSEIAVIAVGSYLDKHDRQNF
jgi:hypothetical protein